MDSKRHEQFLTDLYDEYFKRLFTIAMGFFDYDTCYEQIAAECVQDVFVKAARCYDVLENHPNVGGWLVEACKNQVRNAKRRQAVEKKNLSSSIDSSNFKPLEDPTATIDFWIAQQENQALIDEIGKLLIGKETIIFADYFISDMKEKEVAAKNGMTLSAVKATIRRIREKAKRIKLPNMIIFFTLWVSSR